MACPPLTLILLHLMIFFHALFIARSKAISSQVSTVRDSDNWTNWLHYIQATSTQSLNDAKASSPSSTTDFTDDSCRPTSINFTISWIGAGAQRRIFVARAGSRNFTTIQAAVDYVPKHNQIPTLICIAAGEYREKVLVPKTKDYITFIGESSGNGTVIVWNDTAGTISAQTNSPLRTYNSPTVAVSAKLFVARNIIFEGEVGRQAVALRITGDSAAFYNCKFLGHQDTLYDQKGRHYFKNCFIQGSVDFIFGNGRSVYKDCYVRALAVGYEATGSVTAQKRNTLQLDSGFSFLNCNITGDGNVYLGRAWGPDSRVVFAYTWMADVVVPEGWNDWGIPSRERTVFYAEFECSGPGALNSTRVAWARQLTAQEAQPFLSVGFINGETWLQEI